MPSRTRSLTLLSLVVTLAGGCSTTTPVSQRVLSNDPYLGTERVEVDRDHLDRYTCPNESGLMCTCGSLRFGTCVCKC
jgi:hypothetical protein